MTLYRGNDEFLYLVRGDKREGERHSDEFLRSEAVLKFTKLFYVGENLLPGSEGRTVWLTDIEPERVRVAKATFDKWQ